MEDDEARFVEATLASADWLTGKLEQSARALRTVAAAPAAGEAEKVDATDLFLKRFADAFEAGKRLFRAGLLVEEASQDKLTYIDTLLLAESMGVLASADAWRDIGKVRNRVVHEYAMDRASAAEAVENALRVSTPLLDLVRTTAAHIRRRRVELGRSAP